jgi:diguanylate cyclase (GGDEF)-like protein
MISDPEHRDDSTLEREQSAAEAEQSRADVEQTLSDSDQTGSDRDQISSDRDQAAADIDQSASDEEHARDADPALYERARQMRAESTSERRLTSEARGTRSVIRDGVADQRDRLAAARDLTSAARDELAAALDAELETLEREHAISEVGVPDAGEASSPATRARVLTAESRARAALQRRAAAEDRADAARDRAFAALDRRAYGEELANAETDEVTGALRRGVGLAALQREMDRTGRTGEQLAVVFIDVDGLKAVNDEHGHAAGDELLRTVVRIISDEFRSYDVILRYGGDEFVCSLAGDGLEGIGKRFARVAGNLDEAIRGAAISIGVSRRRSQDTVETLIDRADTKMIGGRRERRHIGGRAPAARERTRAG